MGSCRISARLKLTMEEIADGAGFSCSKPGAYLAYYVSSSPALILIRVIQQALHKTKCFQVVKGIVNQCVNVVVGNELVNISFCHPFLLAFRVPGRFHGRGLKFFILICRLVLFLFMPIDRLGKFSKFSSKPDKVENAGNLAAIDIF